MKLEEYKKKQLQSLKLPSNLEIKTKNITPYTLLKIHDDLDIEFDSDKAYSAEVIERLFREFIVSPKIPKEIKIDELEREDFIFLHNLIFEKVTFPEEEKKEEKSN